MAASACGTVGRAAPSTAAADGSRPSGSGAAAAALPRRAPCRPCPSFAPDLLHAAGPAARAAPLAAAGSSYSGSAEAGRPARHVAVQPAAPLVRDAWLQHYCGVMLPGLACDAGSSDLLRALAARVGDARRRPRVTCTAAAAAPTALPHVGIADAGRDRAARTGCWRTGSPSDPRRSTASAATTDRGNSGGSGQLYTAPAPLSRPRQRPSNPARREGGRGDVLVLRPGYVPPEPAGSSLLLRRVQACT